MNEADEETVIFKGGTLELSTEINLNGPQNLETETGESFLRPTEPMPSVLSGVSSLSASTASIQDVDNEIIEGRYKAILPQYELPFGCDSIQDFFTSRDGVVEAAIQECITALIFPESDGELIGSWLLTEITFWDNEKERLLLLTTKYLFRIKYDFIAQKKLSFKKISLGDIDTVVLGDLVYPPNSIVPRLNGIANGVTSVVKDCILDKLSKERPKDETQRRLFDGKYFEPKTRNLKGIRLMWNKGESLPLNKKWNPFNEDIPFITFTSHPLFFYKEGDSIADTYSMDSFADHLLQIVEGPHYNQCCIHRSAIVIDNYVGVTSILHNKSNLGFFKVRGKFAF